MPANSSLLRVLSAHNVDETIARLKSIIVENGGVVFAHVDHQANAEKVGMQLAPSQLLIFGNPKLGTPLMQCDLMHGLELPMRILVVEEAPGEVSLNYTDPLSYCSPDDAKARQAAAAIANALAKLANAAGAGQ